ncbi:MAG: IS3 family transposase [Tatlockia sp.]|nr:IS3 family transposase [Tatlockia sp.]
MNNAAMESFYHTLKTEHVYFESYKSREEAKQSNFEYVEVFYNRKRRYSTLGYCAPMVFEEMGENRKIILFLLSIKGCKIRDKQLRQQQTKSSPTIDLKTGKVWLKIPGCF